MTNCHDPLNGGHGYVIHTDQVVWQIAWLMPIVLNSEISWGLTWLNNTSSSVWWVNLLDSYVCTSAREFINVSLRGVISHIIPKVTYLVSP